jgi:hypothetical protein
MDPKIKITGLEEFRIGLRYASEKVKDASRKQMHRSADKIVREAQLNAPVDKHNIEESIHKEITYGLRGRLKIDIVAGGIVNGVNVDQYIALMHENYESYKPGKATLEKRAANPGRYIGSGFLSRAVEENKPRLIESLIDTVKTWWTLK